jgi:hypothetical protein
VLNWLRSDDIQPFQGCLIVVHMDTPNFIRCYLHSTLSGLFDYRSHAYPEFHSGLFTFNPFRVVWLSLTCIPRISFGVIYIQPFQGCLIVVHMHTPNFIWCYLHSTLSGLLNQLLFMVINGITRFTNDVQVQRTWMWIAAGATRGVKCNRKTNSAGVECVVILQCLRNSDNINV